ncbi:hypothetical protein HPB49_014879 [Dermacentor silvarum]|uniref:Uncharacterized protein n=1 Tax=Dermacentor silvarum TaxID=543639 RepID=A0ACB8CFU7_DERSI|nr:hypothetical protein HPB49_014879 [Dermacentor silvarum]
MTPELIRGISDVCAAVEAMDADNAAGRAGDGDMVTVSFEAAQIFCDDGRQREFAPGAVARAMAGLRDQRKTRQFCDVLFRAADGAEMWAHRFVMSANYYAFDEFKLLYKKKKKKKNANWCWVPVITILRIRDYCLDIFKKNLAPESCIDTYRLASSRGYEYLAAEAFRYLVRNFDETLTRQFMAVGVVAGVDLSPKFWLRPRVPKDILFLFGGWTVGATNNMLTYNCRAAKWRVMGSQYTTPRAYHGAAVINQCIYFVGGFDGRECYHSVVCFDVPLARWSAKANMAFERCYVSVAVLQDHIYAMGGFDGHVRTNTVERYDVNANQWSMVASMNDVRSDASAAVAGGRIYIVGGFTGRVVLDTVECYDPSTNAWTRVLTMSSPRSGLKVVAHNDTLYIIGGYNGITRLSSMEQLDVRRARFSELPSMPHVKSNFAAVVLEGCIYIVGGFNGLSTVPLVERYNIEARRWYTVPEIGINCSASAACVVHDVVNPEYKNSRKKIVVWRCPDRFTAQLGVFCDY